MPDNDPIAAAKAALAHAKATFPSGSNGGHDAGVQFAQQHKADPQGGMMGLAQQAGSEKQSLDARARAMQQLIGGR